MNIIIMLIGFSLMMALIFLGGFFWAVKTGQFDDPITPSMRLLHDDISKELNLNKIHTEGSPDDGR